MTLFEKIYWTLFIVNVILFIVYCLLDPEWIVIHEKYVWWIKYPIVIQLAGTFGYVMLRFISGIWGVPIDLFPSCLLF